MTDQSGFFFAEALPRSYLVRMRKTSKVITDFGNKMLYFMTVKGVDVGLLYLTQ
jgi:hypothetical protein